MGEIRSLTVRMGREKTAKPIVEKLREIIWEIEEDRFEGVRGNERMRNEEEIKKKLEKILEVRKEHNGKSTPIWETWMNWRLDGEIEALRWILGETDHLTEDHT